MKKGLILSTVFLLFSLCGKSALAQEEAGHPLSPGEQKDFLLRLEENLSASRTIQAKFTQEKKLSLFNDALVSYGTFCFAAPDRLRWEINQPFHSLLVLNGRELGKYDFPDGKKPRRLKFPAADALLEVLHQITDIHQGNFTAQEKYYDMRVYEGKTASLVLVPKDAKMKGIIQKIEIGFSPALNSVASVAIRENGGDSTVILFSDDRLNSRLPDSLFEVQ
ncbi:MAG TPA: outer membrane lipoprotein carrier protein LolA [bacterium]|jgi:outer membrane lipoprotein-sorting protein|nr:outer membrane lipoprotein carrier protein LolA [bacterium]